MEISIKKPCHENWDSFTPNEQGAFCGKCVKTVVDFSNKSIDEIKEFFIGNLDEKVCGRFEKTQLSSLSFDAFYHEFKGFNFTKRFAVILYLTFGMWLFNASTGSAQTTNHEKGDVDIKIDNSIMGGVRAMPPKKDTVKTCVKPQQNNSLIKGKVKCVEPKPEIQQKMGEVMVVPEKKKAPLPKKSNQKK